MHYIPLTLVVIVWLIFLIGLYFFANNVKSGGINLKRKNDHWTFEEMAIIYDNCNAITANYVYFLRIVYGRHNKRFFLPHAKLKIIFLGDKEENLGEIEIDPNILYDNHKKYLNKKGHHESDSLSKRQLSVLIKRKMQLQNVKHIIVDHNIYAGIILIYDVYLINLFDNQVFCSHINMGINHIEKGSHSTFQRFQFDSIGTYIDYIGPSCNLNIFETILFCQLGASLLLLYCSTFISCKEKMVFCRDYQNLTYTFETAIFASIGVVIITCIILIIYRYSTKANNARFKTVNVISWGCIKYLPYFIWLACIIFDTITVIAMLFLSKYTTLLIRDQQRTYWIIAVTISFFIYSLSMMLLIQVLNIKHHFDYQELPEINFESNKIIKNKELVEEDVCKQFNSKISTINIKIPSNIPLDGTTSELMMNKDATISKILYTAHSNKCKMIKC